MTRLVTPDFLPENLQNPPCPYFEECGACQLQHVTPAAYQEYKFDVVKKLMAQNGIAPKNWLPPVYIAEGTRRRVTLAAYKEKDSVTVGYHRFHSAEILNIDHCPLLVDPLNKIVKQLPLLMVDILPRQVKVDIQLQMADDGTIDCVLTGLSTKDDKKQDARQTDKLAHFVEACGLKRISFCADEFSEPETQIELDKITKNSGVLTVEISPSSFLQPSEEGESALVSAVMQGLGKIGKRDKVLDLFSGCGTFAGAVLSKSMVHAVEADDGMARSLLNAAKGHSRFTAEARDLFKEPMTVRELRDYQAVIIDPPRAGAKEQCQKLAASVVPLIISVSCNPATFARDAKILIEGGYKLDTLQMVDQFIYSTHTELVGVFRK